MIDLAIIVGHDRERQGAYSPMLDQHEWEWCRDLATLLVGAVHRLPGRPILASVFEREPGLLYSEAMRRLCQAVNAAGPKLCLSLHFNSGVPWSGCAALHWPGSARGDRAAEVIGLAARGAIGNLWRGIHAQSRSWSTVGYSDDGKPIPAGKVLRVLRDTAAPCTILEPFVGSNEADALAATRARNDGRLPLALAEACAQLIAEWGA
jgi:hypothetical protein